MIATSESRRVRELQGRLARWRKRLRDDARLFAMGSAGGCSGARLERTAQHYADALDQLRIAQAADHAAARNFSSLSSGGAT